MHPIVALFAYQIAWINDWSRLKIYDKSRQVGITFAETWSIVMYLLSVPNQCWYYLSISEDRSAEAIEYAISHCIVLGALVQVESSMHVFKRVKWRQLMIKFPNGSQLIGLPANPITVRGIHGHVTLDEFAHHLHADLIWRAISPAITWGYCMHVISTPNGMQGRFYGIWSDDGKHDTEDIEVALRAGLQPIADRWSRHFISAEQAHDQGHPIDLELAKELAGDELTWLQEYCGKFLDEQIVLLPYAMIDAATVPEATVVFDAQKPAGPLYGGYDVARKRDLAVLWLNELRPTGRLLQKACIGLKQTEFSVQEKVISDHMRFTRKLCIDETGMGAHLAENMNKRFGERAEGVSFTGDVPATIAARVRQALEKGRIGLADDPAIRMDFHSVKRNYTLAGNVRYEAPRTPEGHADRFWAFGLALEAEARAPGSALEGKSLAAPRVNRIGRDWSRGI